MAAAALAWCVVVLAAGVRWRPTAVRRSVPRGSRPQLLQLLGSGLRRRFGRRADPELDRRVGHTTAATLAALPLGPVPAVVAALIVGMRPVVVAHRARRSRRRRSIAELPELIDLLRLAIAGGVTLVDALAAVTRHPRGPVGRELSRVVELVAAGRRVADALRDIAPDLDDVAQPLARALASSQDYGSPLEPLLVRLADEARSERRRQAEIAARRVPVRLLGPLVLCVLPAFVLVALVPTLVGTLDSLQA